MYCSNLTKGRRTGVHFSHTHPSSDNSSFSDIINLCILVTNISKDYMYPQRKYINNTQAITVTSFF